jgi:hypothetical protein
MRSLAKNYTESEKGQRSASGDCQARQHPNIAMRAFGLVVLFEKTGPIHSFSPCFSVRG